MEVSEKINKDKFNIWHAVFKSKGGRHLSNPVAIGDYVYVKYTFSGACGYKELCEKHARLTTDVTETRRGFCKKLKVKLIKFFQ